MKSNISKSRPLQILTLAAALACGCAAQAAPITKAGTGTDLNDGTSWGGSAPGSADIATWNSTSLGAGLALGADTEWLGLSISGAQTDVDISGGGVLTLGASGIDMSTSAVNLGISNPITLGGNQPWHLKSGQTLTSSGVVSGGFGLTLGAGVPVISSATYSAAFLPASPATVAVFPGVSLASVTGVSGMVGGLAIPTTTGQPGTVYFYSNNGTTATFQLQIADSGYTKGVKVQLTQVGGDIHGTVLYAKYYLGDNGDNFDTTGTPADVSSGPDVYYYGCAGVTINYNTTVASAGTFVLSGSNTYTGNTTVNDGALHLSNGGSLKFVIGATSGTNNSISGSGTVTLDGAFEIDTTLADASALTTGSWTLENVTSLTGAYGSSFTVTGFTNAGSDKWTKSVGAKLYTFDETTGTLTLSPSGFSGWAITMTAWNFEGIPLDEYSGSINNTLGAPWVEFDTTDNFHDWAVQTTGGTFDGQFADTGIVVGFSKGASGGFIERSIGTTVGLESSISFALDVVERSNRNDWGAITISLTGSISGAIGTPFLLNPNNASFTGANDILLQQAAGTFSLSALPAQELFLRISNSSGSDVDTQESFIDNVTATVLTLSPSGFSGWADANGVTGGPSGDSDNDGIRNLVEYALNLNFAGSDGAPGTFSGNVLTFTKRAEAITNADVTYVIETSPDLTTWTPVVTHAPGNTDPTISYSLPAGAEKLFSRLNVAIP